VISMIVGAVMIVAAWAVCERLLGWRDTSTLWFGSLLLAAWLIFGAWLVVTGWAA